MFLAYKALIGETKQIELEFGNVGFQGEENRTTWRKPLGARTRTDNKFNKHLTPRPGIGPRPWMGGEAYFPFVIGRCHHW